MPFNLYVSYRWIGNDAVSAVLIELLYDGR